MIWGSEQSAIQKEVIKACQTEYESMREVLRDDARNLIDESIKDAFEKLENRIKENTQQLIENNHQHLLKELQYQIKPLAELLQKEGDQTQQSAETGNVMSPHKGWARIPYKRRKKSIKHYFLQNVMLKPIFLLIFLVVILLFLIRVPCDFGSLMPADTTSPETDGSESLTEQQQLDNYLADLKTKHETYAKALSHIAKTPTAPEHLKLKELINKISTADGLENTNNSIISEPQKERFAGFVNQSPIPWDFSVIGIGSFEYIAAIKCKPSFCNDKIKIDLEIGDITDDILTALNQSLPESVRLKSVPQKYKDNKKANGFTEDFKEFMAAVVLAHIMQKD